MRLTTLFILVLSIATAQTAKVVEVTDPWDRKELKLLVELKASTAKHYDNAIKKIELKYLVVEDRDADRGSSVYREDSASYNIGSVMGTGTIIGWRPDQSAAVDPCYYSWESVACLEKKLANARKREAEGIKPAPAPHYRYWRQGFESGYEFSEGFRFIVPKPPPVVTPRGYWGSTIMPLTTTLP